MDEGLGVQPRPALLVPLVVDVDPVFQLWARFGRTGGAGWFQVDRVQALLAEAGVLREGEEQLLHHGAGTPPWLRAQRQRAAVGRGVTALVTVICRSGGLADRGAAVCGGAQGVAAHAVLAPAEAAAGQRGVGGLADQTASAPEGAARGHRVGTHQ